MPAVTVLSKPKGLPIAITHSPGCKRSELPMETVGRLLDGIWITATSVTGSWPKTLPSKVRPSLSVTLTRSALLTTWALVKIWPFAFKINPEPVPRTTRSLGCASGGTPKNRRAIGSSNASGKRLATVLEALIRTTAGPSFCTAATTKLGSLILGSAARLFSTGAGLTGELAMGDAGDWLTWESREEPRKVQPLTDVTATPANSDNTW